MASTRESRALRTFQYAAWLLGLAACTTSAPTAPMSPVIPGATTPNGAAVSGTTGAAATTPTAGTIATATAGTPANTAPRAGTGAPNPGDAPNTVTAGTMAAAAGSTSGAAGMPGNIPVPGGSEWPMMGHDIGSTYLNDKETVLTKDNAASLKEAWTADLGGNVLSAPLQVGDKVYAAGPGTLRAFEAASGKELWKVNASSTATLAYSDGMLYMNNNQGVVVAYSAADGKMVWMKQPDKQASDGSSSPVIAGDLILIGGSNGSLELSGGGTFQGYLSALDRKTGDIKWTRYTVASGTKGASIWSTASADLALGRAFAGTGNNYGAPASDTSDAIVAFDLKSGEIVWKNQRVMNDTFGGGFGPDADFGANPVLYETMVGGKMTQLVAAGAKSGSAHAVRRDDGMLVWTRSLGGGAADGSSGIFTNSAWSGKHMIFAENNGAGSATLHALNGATGEIVWKRNLPGQVWGRTAIANGVGVVGAGATVEVFDVETGAMIKSFPTKGGTAASGITIANGRVAFGEGFAWSGGRGGRTLTVLSVQ